MSQQKEDLVQEVVARLIYPFTDYLPTDSASVMCYQTLCQLDMVKVAQAGEIEFLEAVSAQFSSKCISKMTFRVEVVKFRKYTLYNPINVFCYLGYYDLFIMFAARHPTLKINNKLLKLCYSIPDTHMCIRYLFNHHIVVNNIVDKAFAQDDISLIMKSLLIGHLSDIVPSLVNAKLICFEEVCQVYQNQLLWPYIREEKSILEYIALIFGDNHTLFLIRLHMLGYQLAARDDDMCIEIIHVYIDYPELIPLYSDGFNSNYQTVVALTIIAYERGILHRVIIDEDRLTNLLTYPGTILCELFVSILGLYSSNRVVSHVLGVAPHCYSIAFYTKVLSCASEPQLRDILSPRVKKNHVFLQYVNSPEYYPYFVTLCAYRPKFVVKMFSRLEFDTTAVSSISGHINPRSTQCEWLFTGRDNRFESRAGNDAFVREYVILILRQLIREYLQQVNEYFYGYYVSRKNDYFNYMLEKTQECSCPSRGNNVEWYCNRQGKVYVCENCLLIERAILPRMVNKYGYYDYHVDYVRAESKKDARDPLVAKWGRQIPPGLERGEVYPAGYVDGFVFGDICTHPACYKNYI